LLNEHENASSDLLSDCAHALERLLPGIVNGPIVDAGAWNDRAGFAAAHGHQVAGARSELCCQKLRPSGGQVDAQLAHGRDDLGVHAVCRLSPRGDRPRHCGVGQLIEKRGGDLGPPCIMDAGKYDSTSGHGLVYAMDGVNIVNIVNKKFIPLSRQRKDRPLYLKRGSFA